ncbi:MAG TPA: ferritin-like domain-containing protein [Mariniphaga sp.]|nr:ferritin-like domain-containing protein [Mariniphaga sp.]
MADKLNDLKDLLEHELKDLYSAENQVSKALPKLAKSAKSKKLKDAFELHLKQTQKQIERLEKVASDIKVDLKGEQCEAMKGLVKEGEEMMKEKAASAVHDAGLIASAQRVEHYEIAGYGTVVRYLEMLNEKSSAKLMSETLKEEKETDKKLSQLAEEINAEAM